MTTVEIIRAWKDPQYWERLSAEQRELLPPHPAGLVELDDAYLDAVAGGRPAPGMCSLGFRCHNCTGWAGCSQ